MQGLQAGNQMAKSLGVLGGILLQFGVGELLSTANCRRAVDVNYAAVFRVEQDADPAGFVALPFANTVFNLHLLARQPRSPY